MICPRCKQSARTLWGNGDYPNVSYRCEQCCDDDTGRAVFWAIAVPVGIAIVVWLSCLLSQL